MASDTSMQASAGPKKDYGYRQRIEKVASSPFYVRIDTGPNLEEAWLCLDDGEADTHRVAKFVSITYADAFVEFWQSAAARRTAP